MTDLVKTVTDVLVAAGTGALAVFTAVLAYRTSQLAKEGREERKLTEKALEASNRLAGIAEQQLAEAQKQTKASQDQAALTQRSVQAAVQPMLVDVPLDIGEGGQEIVTFEDGTAVHYVYPADVVVPADTGDVVHLSVPLRNIGPGPALITGLGIFVTREASRHGQMTKAVVAHGELTRFNFTVPKGRAEYYDIINAMARGGPGRG